MADYKRMVSYMYQYENGVKRKNVGYARIEAKSGQCKITLHMQLLGQLDSIFPTYLIQRDDNTMELIYLGDSVLKNQLMDSKLMAEESNIMGSGFRLSDMGGLLIFLNENIFFATEWDDRPIVAKEVLHALRPKPKNNIPHKKAGELIEESNITVNIEMNKSPLTTHEEARVEETNQMNEAEIIEADANTSDNREVEARVAEVLYAEEKLENEIPDPAFAFDDISIPKYKLPRGWKTIERLQKPSNYVETMKYTKISDLKADLIMEENTVEGSLKNAQSETENSEMLATKENRELLKKADQLTETDMTENERAEGEMSEDGLPEDSLSDYADDMDNAENIHAGMEMEEDIPDPVTAQHFFDNYPRIYPFEDNEVILCVKIEPKDIGLLPKETWALSNNSFLMHGFYCYHHLIFAKLKNRYGCHYVIGIPGIYHNRERFMARMFGFEDFKSIRKRELKQGDFGYWYVPVNL